MHLKRIVLKNFRSFSGVTAIENISPNHSAFVGNNGTGKSSIFEALEFILTHDKKTQLKELLLLVTHRKTDGYVELVFTNCHDLFQGELTIRKTYSLRKCGRILFYINGNKVNNKYFFDVLEICRFSFYHPFIYCREMVLDFASISPKNKLHFILKNLGASFYEYYSFSKKIKRFLEGNELKLGKFKSICRSEIDVTRDEYLLKRKKLMCLKISIIYNISKKNIQLWKSKKLELESLQKDNFTDIDNINIKMSHLKKKECEIMDFINVQKNIVEDLSNEEIDLIRINEKLILKLTTLNNELEFLKKCKPSNGDKYSKKISTTNEKIAQIEVTLETMKREYYDLKIRLRIKERERLDLLDKIENQESLINESYQSQWLLDKESSLKEQMKLLHEELHHLNNVTVKLNNKKLKLMEKLNDLKIIKDSVKTTSETIQLEKKKLIELQTNICLLRRQEHSLNDEIDLISKNIQEVGLKLRKRVGDSIIKGCEYVLEIIDNWKSSEERMTGRYYGLVINNCKWPNGLNTAIETAIGNRLFSHIISDHKFGTQILHIMKENNLPGEVTFIPVNGIISPNFNYPSFKNAEPLLNKLEYSSNLESVMRHLFHGIMLCTDLEAASEVAKIGGVTCITVQGDRVSRNRDFYGGYFDLSKSSILMYNELEKLQTESQSRTKQLEVLKTMICEKEVHLIQIISSIQKNKFCLQNKSSEPQIERLNKEICVIKKELFSNEDKIKTNLCLLNELEAYTKLLNQDKGQIFDSTTFNNKLQILNQDITLIEKKINEVSLQILKLDQEKHMLEDNVDLYTKQLKFNIAESSVIQEKENNVHDCSTKLSIITHKLNKVRHELNQINAGLIEARNSLNKLTEIETKLKDFKMKNINQGINCMSMEQIHKEIDYCSSKIMENHSLLKKIEIENKLDFRLCVKLSKLSLNSLQVKYQRTKNKLDQLEEDFLNHTHEFKETVEEIFGRLDTFFSRNKNLFLQLDEWMTNLTELNLRKIAEKYSDFYNRISSGIESYLFADDDGSIDRVCPDVTGILITVNLPGCLEQNVEDLSYGQKICITLALAFTFASINTVPFFVFDEIINGLSRNERNIVNEIIKSFEESIQIFSSEHSFDAVEGIQHLYSVKHGHTGSNVFQISRNPEEI